MTTVEHTGAAGGAPAKLHTLIYLSDTHGDATGHISPVNEQLTSDAFAKVPFDSIHPVRAYLAAYDGRLVLLARVDFEYADPWHLHDAYEYPCREAVSAYLDAATAEMRERAQTLGLDAPCAVLPPCPDTDPGTFVVYAAFDLTAVRDGRHAASLITQVFADIPTRRNYPTPETDADALAQAYGGRWGAHPRHPVNDWIYQVANGDTRQGYWDWVASEARRAVEDAVAADVASIRPTPSPSL